MMIRSSMLAAATLAISAAVSWGQATIPVSGAQVTDNALNPLTGKILFTVTDSTDTPVLYTPLGGTQTGATISVTVVAGKVQTTGGYTPQIPNPATMAPSGALFRVQIENTSGSVIYDTFPKVNITQAFFSIDAYAVPAGINATGLGNPRMACSPAGLYTDTTSASPYPWVCSKLVDGSTRWTQNPSNSPICRAANNAAAAVSSTGGIDCIDATAAYATPGLVYGSPVSGNAGALGLIPAGGGGGGINGLAGDIVVPANSTGVPTALLPIITVPGSYTKVSVNGKGQVTSGGPITAADLPLTITSNTSGSSASATTATNANYATTAGSANTATKANALAAAPAGCADANSAIHQLNPDGSPLSCLPVGSSSGGTSGSLIGDGTTPTINGATPFTLSTVGTSGTFVKVQTDTKGRVVSGANQINPATDVSSASVLPNAVVPPTIISGVTCSPSIPCTVAGGGGSGSTTIGTVTNSGTVGTFTNSGTSTSPVLNVNFPLPGGGSGGSGTVGSGTQGQFCVYISAGTTCSGYTLGYADVENAQALDPRGSEAILGQGNGTYTAVPTGKIALVQDAANGYLSDFRPDGTKHQLVTDLVAGTNVTLNRTGPSIIINATSSGGGGGTACVPTAITASATPTINVATSCIQYIHLTANVTSVSVTNISTASPNLTLFVCNDATAYTFPVIAALHGSQATTSVAIPANSCSGQSFYNLNSTTAMLSAGFPTTNSQ